MNKVHWKSNGSALSLVTRVIVDTLQIVVATYPYRIIQRKKFETNTFPITFHSGIYNYPILDRNS